MYYNFDIFLLKSETHYWFLEQNLFSNVILHGRIETGVMIVRFKYSMAP